MNFQKILILAVLSGCFLIAWYGFNSVAPLSVESDVRVISLTDQHPIEPIKPKPLVITQPKFIDPVKPTKPVKIAKESVWNSLSHDFQLDHRAQSTQVQAEIRKLLADQGKLYQVLKAAGPYIYFIFEQTQNRGLPAEIALIPVIESEFNPNNRSHKGALGLWQLMRGTASLLGVNVTSAYDGRRSVIFSTHAALVYLDDLGKNFKGDWYLALAAYNSGQARIEKAVRRTGSQSFWNLPLPKETKYYVPKLLAVAAIVNNPKKYGVVLPPISNKPYFVELKVKKLVNLDKIAKSSGISIETLRILNPDYKQGIVIPKRGAYTLLVPISEEVAMRAHLADTII